jgi:hypothetical protein
MIPLRNRGVFVTPFFISLLSRQSLDALRHLLPAMLLTGGFAAAASAAAFQYDNALSGNYADEGDGNVLHAYGTAELNPPPGQPPSPLMYSTIENTLVQDYVQPSGVYDWGNEATGSVQASNLVPSSDSFVTLDGDGSAAIQARFGAEALFDVDPPSPYGFGGVAVGAVGTELYNAITGLNPGQLYTIQYDWDVNATAGAPSTALGNSQAQGYMTAYVEDFVNGAIGGTIFDESVTNSITGFPPINITPSGSDSFSFVATANPTFLVVSVSSVDVTGMANTADQFEVSDLNGSTFFGEATFTISTVPEPATTAISLSALLLISGRRPRQRARG